MSLVTLRNPETGEQVAVEDPTPYEGWEHVCDGIPVPDLQADMWERVKAIREARQRGTCETPAGVVQCDEKSRGFITGLVMKAQMQGDAFGVAFTLNDNSQVELDATGISDLGIAVAEFIDATHQHSRTLYDEIYAAGTTAEDLAEMDINDGWPT